MDGVNSRKLMTKLDCLIREAPFNTKPCTEALSAFRSVVTSTFSHSLHPDYKEHIRHFTKKYQELQEYSETWYNIKLSITWKVHIISVHLEEFLSRKAVGLARYAEQASEAAHCKIKPIERRYGTNITNPSHGRRLKDVVVNFSSNNL